MILIPGRNIEYETKAVEVGRELYVKAPPVNIIDQACRYYRQVSYKYVHIDWHFTFKFRKKCQSRLFLIGFSQHTLLIALVAIGFSEEHVKIITKTENSKGTIITFTNGFELRIDTS